MINRRHPHRLVAFVLALSIVLLPLADVSAQRRPVRRPESSGSNNQMLPTATVPRPRLVLLIVVDQFRYDFFERFGDLFSLRGLRMLQHGGAVWTNANYDHVPTETAPGHATLMTGTWPAENGIIGNEWFDRESGKRVSNVSDDTARLLGGGEGEAASSPRRLLASTLSDELRIQTNGRAKSIGISLKDRAAILPVGRHASAAYWFSNQSGNMVASNFYFNQLPAWVTSFNEKRPADKYFGARWERLLAPAEYERRAGPDAPPWENIGQAKDTVTFPHVVTGGAAACCNRDFYNALAYTPFANDMLVEFAEQAIANEALGADIDTDVLSVSFSSNDYVGHRFGPYSQEAMDMAVRVDRQIERLLEIVETRVGLRNTVVVFTADHGVAPVPEHAMSLGLPGGRIKPSDLLTTVRNAVRARYNPPNESQDRTTDYILTFANESIYLNPVALKRDNIRTEEIERVVGDALMTVPGIRRYFTRTQLMNGAVSPDDALARRVLHGFHPQRSGDVMVIQEPFKYVNDYAGASHGSPYSYDTHVPLIIMGNGIARGRYIQPAAPSDIAPTLAALLRVQPPSNSTGRVLTEALSIGQQPAATTRSASGPLVVTPDLVP